MAIRLSTTNAKAGGRCRSLPSQLSMWHRPNPAAKLSACQDDCGIACLQFTIQFFGGKCGRTKPKFSKIMKIYQNDNINMDLKALNYLKLFLLERSETVALSLFFVHLMRLSGRSGHRGPPPTPPTRSLTHPSERCIDPCDSPGRSAGCFASSRSSPGHSQSCYKTVVLFPPSFESLPCILAFKVFKSQSNSNNSPAGPSDGACRGARRESERAQDAWHD